jgi:sorbitol-6-phosphate 2-dehydrogenase
VGRFELYGQYAKRLGISEAEVRQRYVDQVPLKRGCTYDDVTNVLVFLASDQSSYMTGQAINVTGGQEMRDEHLRRLWLRPDPGRPVSG